MITIDGSRGEGGGQVLRSSLALSMLTGTPVRISAIRAGRPKPGLMRQHLTCVLAAAEISSARVAGASVGSREIIFEPGSTRAGDYRFSIGTAGGTMLVLQAVLPALVAASANGQASSITIEGGTHNSNAPPFEFFKLALLPLLNAAGANMAARLDRHGFYPAGGGRISVDIAPSPGFRPVSALERGPRRLARACAIVSRLGASIARRELAVLSERIGLSDADCEVIDVPEPIGPGNAAYVELRYEGVTEVFSAVGEHGKTAERVAHELSDEVRAYIAAGAPIGPHLTDQLMVPLCAMAGGCYACAGLTEHSRTNIEVVEAFGGRVRRESDGVVRIEPLGS